MYMSDDKKTPEEFYQTRSDDIGTFKTIEPSRLFTFAGDDSREATLDFSGDSVTYSGELSIDESAKIFFEDFHHLLKM